MAQLPEGKDVFLAIDANAIIHRAYHAYPDTLSNSKGLQLNAVYGFTSMLLSVLSEFDPKYVVCAFDTAKPTFRHTQFPEYKAHRKPVDQSLIDQFPLVENVLKSFNIPIIKKEGFEADDILGDLSRKARSGKWEDYGLEMVIVSGDKDLLQLVGSNVYVCLPVGNFRNLLLYDEEETVEKMGVKPNQIIDYKALVGDPSDNIPGVKGIGVKGASALIQKYGSVDGIYQNLEELTPRQANLLRDGVEQMEMSRGLATIEDDIGITLGLEECLLTDYDRSEVLEMFQEYEFRSLINKIPKQPALQEQQMGQIGMFGGEGKATSDSSSSGGLPEQDPDYEKIEVKEIEFGKYSEFLTTGKGVKAKYFYYFPLGAFMSLGNDPSGALFAVIVDNSGEKGGGRMILGCETAQELAECFTTDGVRETYFYGWEFFAEDLAGCDVVLEKSEFDNVFDLALAAHTLSSGEKNVQFDSILYKYLGINIPPIESVEAVEENLSNFLKLSVAVKEEFDSRKLSGASKQRMIFLFDDKNVKGESMFQKLFYDYEIYLSWVLGRMEARGVSVDVKKRETLKKELEKEVNSSQEEVFSAVGHEFNLNSPAQLASVLYDELGLPQGRGKTGRSTRESVLNKLEPLHPAISHVLKFRELSKILNTYVNPLSELMTPDDPSSKNPVMSVHTNFIQTGTSSGRLSSQDPNMQNLPIKGDWSYKVRELFVPRKGYKFFGMDYSQIELRILADMSQDDVLIRDFQQDKDIHAATASRILDKPLKNVSDKDRRLGKTINFGIVYGQTKFGLSAMLDIPVDDAEGYINEYFNNYTGVKNYIDETSKQVRTDGYVETMMGRRRYIDGLDSSNQRIQNASMREAINMPIQGSAADIIRIAMTQIEKDVISKMPEDVYMLLQIHDELIFEIKEDVIDKVKDDLQSRFEGIVKLSVPLVVHSSVGDDLSMLK